MAQAAYNVLPKNSFGETRPEILHTSTFLTVRHVLEKEAAKAISISFGPEQQSDPLSPAGPSMVHKHRRPLLDAVASFMCMRPRP